MPGQKFEREDIWQYQWRGEFNNVESGTEMLRAICFQLWVEQPERFRRLPDEFPVTEKAWFSRTGDGMFAGYLIGDSGVWLDTNMSTQRKMEFAKSLLRHFGHGAEEITFLTTKQSKK